MCTKLCKSVILASYSLFLFVVLLTASKADSNCVATNASSFRACAGQVNQGTSSSINVQGGIVCSSQDPCDIILKNIHRPVSIQGNADGNSGFYKTSGFGSALIFISDSDQIRIENLNFTEIPNRLGGPDKERGLTKKNLSCDHSNGCKAPIFIENSKFIVLNKLKITNGKKFNIGLNKVEDITITNSHFGDAFMFGIWGTGGVRQNIENNTFLNIRSNAILYDTKNSVLKNNVFNHNHYTAAFNVCQGNGGLCPGGQILLIGGTMDLLIQGNTFTKQNMIEASLEGQGIEFFYSPKLGSPPIRNVTITENKFLHNRATSAFINDKKKNKITGVKFFNNQIFGNISKGYGDFNLPGAKVGKNCKNKSCPGIP